VEPQTRFARLGKDRIAYQVMGDGPLDLVFTPGSFGNIDIHPRGSRGGLVLQSPCLVHAAHPVRQAGNQRVGAPPVGIASLLGVLRGGAAGGPGRGRLRTLGDHGEPRRRTDGDAVRRHVPGADDRADPGEHQHPAPRGRRVPGCLPLRGCGDARTDGGVVGYRGLGRRADPQPRRRRAVHEVVREDDSGDRQQGRSTGLLPGRDPRSMPVRS